MAIRKIEMKKSDIVVGKLMDDTLAKWLGLEIGCNNAGEKVAIIDYSGDFYDSNGNCLLYYIRLGEKLHLNEYGEQTFTVTADVYHRNDLSEEEACLTDWEFAWDYDSTYDEDDDERSLTIKIKDED